MIAALVLAATFAMYPLPDKQAPTEIVQHAGKLWFVSWHRLPKMQAFFGQITTRGRIRTQRAPADHMPGMTTHAPDGTLWLSDAGKPVFWRVSPKGKVDSVKGRYWTEGIAYGPDGRLWCTHAGPGITRWGTDGSEHGSWTIPDDRPMTSSSVPPLPGPRASWIVAGSDGALWFVEGYYHRIGRITTAGEFTMFNVPKVESYNELIAGPDGALWFTTSENAIGRMTTSGELTTITTGFMAMPIAADAKGRIWYAFGPRAGYIDTDRSVHEFEVPGAKMIRSLAEGPDGAMWFADELAGAIGRIEQP